jgi:hypothetical protein
MKTKKKYNYISESDVYNASIDIYGYNEPIKLRSKSYKPAMAAKPESNDKKIK